MCAITLQACSKSSEVLRIPVSRPRDYDMLLCTCVRHDLGGADDWKVTTGYVGYTLRYFRTETPRIVLEPSPLLPLAAR